MTPPDPGPLRAADVVDGPDDWHRLSPWMIAVKPVEQLPQLVPVLIAIFVAGRGAPGIALILTLVVVPMVTIVPWLTTRYQVTAEHVRVRSGLLTRKVATARRDRIRSVDMTASLPQRILRLQRVRIGTGGDDAGSTVELNAIAAPEAQAIHDSVMATVVRESSLPGTASAATSAPASPSVQLAAFRPAWLRFAPFSAGGLATAAAIGGIGAQVANEAGFFELGASTAESVVGFLRDIPVAVLIFGVIVAVLVVGGVLSLVGYVLAYWGFTLWRHPEDGTLRMRRGLLTNTATSLDENRIHGVHLDEPLLMRPLGGARLHAIATGSQKHPLLLPPAPRAEAVRVGELVAADGDELTIAPTPHGRAARLRRVTRASWGGVVIAAILAGLVAGPLSWPWLIVAVVALTLAPVLGWLRYRNLGTLVTGSAVIISPPRVARHRYVLDRDGVSGWATRETFFQRRADVCTVTAATAAGSEGYAAVDLREPVAVGLMTTVSPELLAPFVEEAGER